MKSVILKVGQARCWMVRPTHQQEAGGHVPHRWRLPVSKQVASWLVPLSEADLERERVPKRRGSGANKARFRKAPWSGRRKEQAAGSSVNQ